MATAYDEALALLAGSGVEYGAGQSNVGPMAAHALMALGHPDRVVPWVEAYSEQLGAVPRPRGVITRDRWRSALGVANRMGEWAAFFERELRQASWQVVFRDWLPRLMPGLSGAAGHGFLRTAYAIQNLTEETTDVRLEELAQGMAYWAGSFIKLPGIPGSRATGKLTPYEALARIKWQHKKRRPSFRLIDDGIRGLSGFSPFAGVLNLVPIPDVPEQLITQTTEALARVYLAHRHDPVKRMPFILAIMVPSAVRFILPHLEPPEDAMLLRHGWQFAGAMYAIYGRANPVERWEEPPGDQTQLVAKALGCGDAYAILFTEVCLREYRMQPTSVYRAAAWDAVERLSRPEANVANSGD